jgi:hypothetical protein
LTAVLCGQAVNTAGAGWWEGGMEVVIRIALMFFFVQFLVITTLMVIALLMARPEVPTLGREPWQDTLKRILRYTIHIPSRIFRSLLRLMHHMHSMRAIN